MQLQQAEPIELSPLPQKTILSVLGALQVQQMKLDQKGLSNLPLPGCPNPCSPAALVSYKGDSGPPQGVQIPGHGC